MTRYPASRTRRFVDGTLAATTIQWAIFIATTIAGICFACNVIQSFGVGLPSPIGWAADREPAETDAVADSAPPRFGIWQIVSILWFALMGVYGFRIFRSRPSDAESDKRSPASLKTQFVDKRQAILKILVADKSNVSQSRLQIRHVMTSHTSVVPPETSKRTLREIMERNEHLHLLVCDKDRKLIGLVSDRDVRTMNGGCVADITMRDPFSVSPDSFVSPAVSQMLNRHISCLPVVKDDRVCGVVTTSGMMMTLQCMLQLFDQTAAATADDTDVGKRAVSTGHEQMAGADEPCEIGTESAI